jgi:hypothetical protein
MTAIAYPFRVADNSGNLVSGATITVGAVTLAAGTPASVPGAKGLASFASLNGSTGISVTYYDSGNGDYVIVYDPESFGEAYIPIVPSKAGSTITGANALIAVIATKDSSRVQTALPNIAPQAAGGLPSTDSSGRVLLQPTQAGVTIPAVTTVTDAVSGIIGVTLPAAVPSLAAIQAGLPTDSSITADCAGAIGATTPPNTAADATLLSRISGSLAPTTGDAFARLGAPAGASVSADIAAIETKLGSPAGASVSADVATANAALALSLSLLGQNQGVRNQQYDGSGNLLSADICAYDTAAHATTNDGATGLVHKWSLALSYSGGTQASQSIAQVS